MRTETPLDGDRLANALRFLGVHFLAPGQEIPETIHKSPARLIRALTRSSEARLRLSLIPLLLDHPEFAAYIPKISASLKPSERITLQCYYTAALYFQKKYAADIAFKQELPDLFSGELGLETSPDVDRNLKALAARQQTLSQAPINWLGTYQHAAQIWFWEKTRLPIQNG